jgi:ferredoxin, 2Fe-2S
MPLIFYVDHSGNMFEADVPVGTSVMQAAVDNGIEGILGECGGNQSCATCHCYVEDAWIATTGVAEGVEFEMVAATSAAEPNSRLSCQIIVTEAMDGLTVRLPESQY